MVVWQVQDASSTRVGRNVDRGLCYGPSDFRVGGVIPVFGRDLFVHDCDAFTRDWYKVLPPCGPLPPLAPSQASRVVTLHGLLMPSLVHGIGGCIYVHVMPPC